MNPLDVHVPHNTHISSNWVTQTCPVLTKHSDIQPIRRDAHQLFRPDCIRKTDQENELSPLESGEGG